MTEESREGRIPCVGFTFQPADPPNEHRLMLQVKNQQLDDADNSVPCALQYRYVSGREWMKRKSRLGAVFGHFARVLDFTDHERRRCLYEHLTRVVLELMNSGYPLKLTVQALQILERTNPDLIEIQDVSQTVARYADCLRRRGNDVALQRGTRGADGSLYGLFSTLTRAQWLLEYWLCNLQRWVEAGESSPVFALAHDRVVSNLVSFLTASPLTKMVHGEVLLTVSFLCALLLLLHETPRISSQNRRRPLGDP